jgi:hypothetical protein
VGVSRSGWTFPNAQIVTLGPDPRGLHLILVPTSIVPSAQGRGRRVVTPGAPDFHLRHRPSPPLKGSCCLDPWNGDQYATRNDIAIQRDLANRLEASARQLSTFHELNHPRILFFGWRATPRPSLFQIGRHFQRHTKIPPRHVLPEADNDASQTTWERNGESPVWHIRSRMVPGLKILMGRVSTISQDSGQEQPLKHDLSIQRGVRPVLAEIFAYRNT